MAKAPPSSDDLSMPVLLRYARNVYASAMRDALSDAGFEDIPENGLHLIGGLARRSVDRPMSQLVAQLGISKQAASQLVDTLVVRGYLRRDVDPDDRRRLTIALTNRGFAAAKVLATSRAKVDAALLARAGPRDLESTRRTLAMLGDMSREPDTEDTRGQR
jgi:DNA-binding MarR family transcriptional regulator